MGRRSRAFRSSAAGIRSASPEIRPTRPRPPDSLTARPSGPAGGGERPATRRAGLGLAQGRFAPPLRIPAPAASPASTPRPPSLRSSSIRPRVATDRPRLASGFAVPPEWRLPASADRTRILPLLQPRLRPPCRLYARAWSPLRPHLGPECCAVSAARRSPATLVPWPCRGMSARPAGLPSPRRASARSGAAAPTLGEAGAAKVEHSIPPAPNLRRPSSRISPSLASPGGLNGGGSRRVPFPPAPQRSAISGVDAAAPAHARSISATGDPDQPFGCGRPRRWRLSRPIGEAGRRW